MQTVIPEDPNMPYDIKDIIEPVLDNQYFFEVMPHFAKNVVVGFGRLGGRSVGIVANQPAWLAASLTLTPVTRLPVLSVSATALTFL